MVAYLKGANEDRRSIDMTTPVVTTFHPQSDFKHCSDNFTVAVFLPYEYQTDQQVSTDEPKRPPKPSSKAVFLFDTPEGVVYVRTFSGFALEDDVLKVGSCRCCNNINKSSGSNYNDVVRRGKQATPRCWCIHKGSLPAQSQALLSC